MLTKTQATKSITIKVGQHRGSRRIWLEGAKPESAGFLPGMRFRIEQDQALKRVSLVLDEAGSRVVSRKRKDARELPVIDVNSNESLAVFESSETVQVILLPGRIDLMPLP